MKTFRFTYFDLEGQRKKVNIEAVSETLAMLKFQSIYDWDQIQSIKIIK